LNKICSLGNRGGVSGPRESSIALPSSVALTHCVRPADRSVGLINTPSARFLLFPANSLTRSPCLQSAGRLTVLMAQTRLLIDRISGDTVTPFVIGLLQCMGTAGGIS
jgi:hypothetical protein